jgi:hypothetical protein
MAFQDPEMVDIVCTKVNIFLRSSVPEYLEIFEAAEKFPLLDDYEEDWPTKDFIRCFLKYSSFQERSKTCVRVSQPLVGQRLQSTTTEVWSGVRV